MTPSARRHRTGVGDRQEGRRIHDDIVVEFLHLIERFGEQRAGEKLCGILRPLAAKQHVQVRDFRKRFQGILPTIGAGENLGEPDRGGSSKHIAERGSRRSASTMMMRLPD